jgi:hypothetical protein
VHENIGGQRIKFATDIIEVADDLQLLVKDTEKARKLAKDAALKQEKSLTDAEGALEKVTRTKHTHTKERALSLFFLIRANKSTIYTAKNGNAPS